MQGGKAKVKAQVKGIEAPPPKEGEEKGHLLIQELWTQGADSIHDMRVVNTDTVSYQSKTLEKCLETAKRETKKQYLNTSIHYWQQFTPFIASVYVLLEVEAEATLERISSRLKQKWKETYSRTCGYMKSRVAITIVWSTHLCIREDRVPASRISVTRPQW